MKSIIYLLFLFSIVSCSNKELDNVAYVLISKSDCINCRRSLPLVFNILSKHEVEIKIINNNCRELELNALRKDFELMVKNPNVICDENLRDELNKLVGTNSTSLVIYQNGKMVFGKPIKSLDVKEIENLLIR